MKKFVKVMATVLASSLLLAACNNDTNGTDGTTDGGDPDTENTDDDGGEETPSGDVVQISFIPSKVEAQETFESIVETYNASQDGVEVTILGVAGDQTPTVLQSNFSSDPASAPTIFAISGPAASGFEQFYTDLSDMEAAGRLSESLAGEVTNEDGAIVGLPSAVEGYGFIYNQTMFEEAGIDPASLNSIDAFVGALETLSGVEGVASPIAFSEETYFLFIHFFNWAVALQDNWQDEMAAVNAGEQSLADLAMVQAWGSALDQIKEYTNLGLATYDEQVAGFAAGQYAMIHQGNWAQPIIVDANVDFEYAYLPFPLEGNTSLAVGTSNAWRVNNAATAEQQQAAKDFLDWLIISEEGQQLSAEELGFIPAYTDVLAPEGGLSESVAEYVSNGETVDWAFNTVFPAGIDIDGAELMQAYYADQITSEELIQQLSDVWADLAG